MATNLEFIKSASGTGVTFIDVTDLFSTDYDVYFWTVTKADVSGSDNMEINVLDSTNTVITDLEYDWAQLSMYANVAFVEQKNTNRPKVDTYGRYSATASKNTGVSGYIFNPYNSSSYTFGTVQTSAWDDGGNCLRGAKTIWVHKVAEQINGIRLSAQGKTFSPIEVSIFGVK